MARASCPAAAAFPLSGPFGARVCRIICAGSTSSNDDPNSKMCALNSNGDGNIERDHARKDSGLLGVYTRFSTWFQM
jgi:hypothetical protein